MYLTRYALLLLPCLLLLSAGRSTALVGEEQAPQEKVTLKIQLPGNKEILVDDIPHREKMTVLDVLNHAKEKKKIRFVYRGKNTTAFLTSINGIKNRGAGGDNWIFRINRKLGNKSFAISTLKANDEVTWTFGKYRP
ncbi:MAG: DUF4430 domain-containing protein [Planctomycetota bacterium]|nr:DUF4430 domain-containing protein [Planctomycetota bacterium]